MTKKIVKQLFSKQRPKEKMQILSSNAIKEFVDTYSRYDQDPYPRAGNWHNVHKKTNNLGYGWIHYSLIRNTKPKRVLVIGSRYGYVPAICALACRDNKKGKVDFVDAGYDARNSEDQGRNWGGVGFWRRIDSKKHFGKFDLQEHIETYLMTSDELKKKYKNRRWGYVYIDADHSYDGVKSDFQRFWPRITKGGFMIFHDINIHELDGQRYGVRQFWQELKKQKEFCMLEFPGETGLGLIQK